MTELMELKDCIKGMKEALEFYAEAEWNDNYPGGVPYTNIESGEIFIDTGNLARDTLKKYRRLLK